MKKILASVLVAGVSFGGVQEASAVKIQKDEENRNVKTTPIKATFKAPLPLVKTPKDMCDKGYTPNRPTKKNSAKSRIVAEKAMNDPESLIGPDLTLWKKESKPTAPVSLIPTPAFQHEVGDAEQENKNPEKVSIKMVFHGGRLRVFTANNRWVDTNVRPGIPFHKVIEAQSYISRHKIPTIIVTFHE